MDQDFHYYGTYYAARSGGYNQEEATLIAKSANFIDFFSEAKYAAYWKLVRDDKKTSNYQIVASLDNPRYTFQSNLLGTGSSPEDGLWCSYHFTPGNYDDPVNTPTRDDVHGSEVANKLPPFIKRDTRGGMNAFKKYNWWPFPGSIKDFEHEKMLNRPQSALSRQLIQDAKKCATDNTRLEVILGCAIGGNEILAGDRTNILGRFKLILLGIRAHVIADTWAHQDFCGLHNVMNTYWDVNYAPESWDPSKMGLGRQSIDYNDGAPDEWNNQVLSATGWQGNFGAVPNGTSYLGHGWMGHFPDFSFVKFRYKPCWSDPHHYVERDNPKEYLAAWLELASLFTQANTGRRLVFSNKFNGDLDKAEKAINARSNLKNGGVARECSAKAWKEIFNELPSSLIDVVKEPDERAILDGMIESTSRIDRYGKNYVNIESDLYLFQIAADYHFHFVKHYLESHGIYRFTGDWSKQTSALLPEASKLFS